MGSIQLRWREAIEVEGQGGGVKVCRVEGVPVVHEEGGDPPM